MNKEQIKLNDLKNTLDEKDYKKILIQMIIDLEKKYYKTMLIDLKAKELFGKTKNNKKLKNIKNQLKILYTSYKEIENIQTNINEIGNNNVIELDYMFKMKCYELFINLKFENNINKRIKIINLLKYNYLKALKEIESLAFSNNKEKYDIINKIKDVLKKLNSDLKKEKKDNQLKKDNEKIPVDTKYKIRIKKEKKRIKEENLTLINDIIDGNDTNSYDLEELVKYFVKCIKTKPLNDNYIKCANDIINRLKQEEFDEKIFYYIYDSLKNKKYELKKDDYQCIILKSIKKLFKDYKEKIEYEEEYVDESLIYKFNIIFSLLFDEKNYNLIKNLINKCPEFINVRKDERHIVCYILELYLENLEKLLNKKYNINFNVDYLKEIYFLFTKNINISLSEADKKDINNQIYLFISRITNDDSKKNIIINEKVYDTIVIKKEAKKDSIKEEVKKLSTHHFNDKEICNLRQINNAYLTRQLIASSSIPFSKDDKDISDKENIVLSNPYVCYNYNKESNILRISMPDISNLVEEGTPIDSYMYNSLLTDTKLDKELLKKFKYTEGVLMPSITFKINLNSKNRPIDLYIYKSKIMPSFEKNSETFNELSEYDKDVEKYANSLLNEAYLYYVTKNNIPFIFSGVQREKKINPNTFTNISVLSKKLSDEEYEKIFNAITSNIGEFHYSNAPFQTDEYNLNLTTPNYLMLLNQRIVKKLILSDLTDRIFVETLDAERLEMEKLVDELNKLIGYKKLDFSLKQKKKKILLK